MSLWLDEQFITKISFRLDGFKQVRTNLYNFKCPLCGDSKKKRNKKRGYLYLNDKLVSDKYFFKCQNCSMSMAFHTFLKEIDTVTYDEYLVELFKEMGTTKKRPALNARPKIITPKPKEIAEVNIKKHSKSKIVDVLADFPRVYDLHDLNPCKKYVTARKLPKWSLRYLRYADDWVDVAELINPEAAKHLWHEPRLIIPFYKKSGELMMVQGRSLEANPYLRYITIKKNNNDKKIFGLERMNKSKPVLVVEGPIDSLFLLNCVAVGDSNLISFKHGDIYLPDNQARNREVVQGYQKIIDAGKNVVIWDRWGYNGKDINDFIINGATVMEIHKYIAKNRVSGLQAQIKLNDWKRV